MKKTHAWVWLAVLVVSAALGTSIAVLPATAQEARTCEDRSEQADALLKQRQVALNEGNVILAFALMQQTENLLAPCVDDTIVTGLFASGSTPRFTPLERMIDDIPMVQVPGGCFMMGSSDGESDEQPEHEICFYLPYWIDKTEVTRSMYAACVNAGACTPAPNSAVSTRDTQPINRLTWFQAEAYCDWRGLELPTEAEWEYAARGPQGLIFPWGNDFISGNVVYSLNSGGTTADVGSLPAGSSWVGALDMSGNVAEWTRSAYLPYPYTRLIGTSTQPRVVRGGSYYFSLSNRLRTTTRSSYAPTDEMDRIGLRCVRPNAAQPAPNDSCEVRYQKAQRLLEQESDSLQQGYINYTLQLITDARVLLEPCISNKAWEPVTQQVNQTAMVQVPAGCFVMGRDNGASDEQPAHPQCFDAFFWIDKTEVTHDMYARCVVAGACTPTSQGSLHAEQPQNHVTWFQARDYCAWRGARLPTEAEWEYAARGPDGWLYPWGDSFGVKQAVYNNRNYGTEDVGSRPRGSSWVGALDMSGNVGEWVSSIYQPYPYTPGDGRENPDNVSSPRVWRGGSFFDYDADRLLTVTRQKNDPAYQSQSHGFRCALSDTE